jgi:hypothetical protein
MRTLRAGALPASDLRPKEVNDVSQPTVVKALLMTLAVLSAIIVSIVAGILSRASGTSLPTAIRHGGVAFGGTVTLAVLVMTAVGLF